MNVLLLCEHFGVHEQRFARAFESHGHKVTPVSSDHESGDQQGNFIPQCAHDSHTIAFGGPLHRMPNWLNTVPSLPYVAVTYAYDVLSLVHSNQTANQAVRTAMNRACGLIADCQTSADAACRLLEGKKIPVLACAWGLDKYSSQSNLHSVEIYNFRKRLRWENCRVIVCVRNFGPLHGVLDVIEAFGIVHKSEPDSRLLLAGDGPLRDQILRRIDVLNLAEFVELTGSIPESAVPNMLEQSDLYVSASLVDGVSISLLQALDAGLPVALSDVGGNNEWKHLLDSELFFTPNDIESLIRALLTGLTQSARVPGRWLSLLNDKANWTLNSGQIIRFCEALLEQSRTQTFIKQP